MKLKLNLDYNRTPEQVKDLSSQALTANYVEGAFNSAYPEGLTGQKRRIIGRLQRKIDDAVASTPPATEIDITPEELIELRSAFALAKFPAVLSKFIIILEDELTTIT